jgi:hypothetical protein
MIKKTIYALSLIAILTIFIALTDKPKENTYTLTEGEAIMLFNSNNQIKQILPTSQAPAYQVTNLNMAIDSIQKVIATQFQKFHPDTVKTKK